MADGEIRPDEVRQRPDGHVGGHVVAVGPADAGEVVDVGGVEGEAEERPETQAERGGAGEGSREGGFFFDCAGGGGGGGIRIPPPPASPGGGEVPLPDLDRRQKEAIHDIRPGGEVVHALREAKVPGVEHGRPEPADDAHVPKQAVVPVQRVATGDVPLQAAQADHVCVEVRQAEDHREGFLHPEHPPEGPFAVVLLDRARGVGGEADGGEGALAGVVAFGGAGPEEEAEVQGEGGRVVDAVLLDAVLFGSRVG